MKLRGSLLPQRHASQHIDHSYARFWQLGPKKDSNLFPLKSLTSNADPNRQPAALFAYRIKKNVSIFTKLLLWTKRRYILSWSLEKKNFNGYHFTYNSFSIIVAKMKNKKYKYIAFNRLFERLVHDTFLHFFFQCRFTSIVNITRALQVLET